MRQYLKPEIKQRLKNDEPLQMKIALALDRKFRTVENWVRDNNIMLTTSTVLDMIRKHYGFKKTEPLTEEREDIPTQSIAA